MFYFLNTVRQFALVVCALGTAALLRADSLTTSQTASISLASQIQVISVPATLALSQTSSAFVSLASSLPINFRVRTSPTGSASLTVQATADFSPTGGPSLTNTDLSYTCVSASLGTPCSLSTPVLLNVGTGVLTFGTSLCTGGGTPCSALDPNTAAVTFTLNDNPAFRTNVYSISLLFTGSAL